MIPVEVTENYREAFLRLFYPAYCGVCRKFLTLKEKKGLCRACEENLEKLRRAPEEILVEATFEALDNAWALYPYQSPVQEILTAIKFSGQRQLLQALAETLQESAKMIISETCYDALLPIPLGRGKLLEREYNQTELIAKCVSRSTSIPILTNILKKRSGVIAQSHLNRAERLANVFGSFSLSGRHKIQDKRFMIIDDILTTGATAEDAARALKAQGAKQVDLFVIARTEIQK